MTIVSPSLLAADFLSLREEIQSIEQAGADWLHLDVMDGHFVPNLSFGFPVIEALRSASSLYFDVHLMISNPEAYIDHYIKAGADLITVHAEIEADLDAIIQTIKQNGKKAGLSIKPGTPITAVLPYLEKVDLILFMTVEPGFGGQAFMEEVLEKIQALNAIRQSNPLFQAVLFEVDGGINEQTALLCTQAGADVLVAGTTIFQHPDRKTIIQALKEC